jgi:hypothetical protein
MSYFEFASPMVSTQHLCYVGRLVPPLVGEQREVIGEVAEVVFQRLGVVIVRVDEDETAPAAQLHLGQSQLI